MRTIRKGVFETNSSSVHTITFVNEQRAMDDEIKYDIPPTLHSQINFFGQGEYYSNGLVKSPQEKADYFSVALAGLMSMKFSEELCQHFSNFYEPLTKRAKITEDDLNETYHSLDDTRKKDILNDLNTRESTPTWLLDSYLKRPQDLVDKYNGLMAAIKDSISAEFARYGVEACWPSSVLDMSDWTKVSDDASAAFVTDGYIDHQSFVYESEDCVKLAELYLYPKVLFFWIFGPGEIYCDSDG